MNDMQIKRRKNEIYFEIYGNQPRFKENQIRPMTKAEKIELEELSCREMINSCLCYGDDFYKKYYRWEYGKGYGNYSCADTYIEALGEETVNRLFEEQKKDFAKAKVVKNVFTDSEGVTYNSIIWNEEEV